MASGPPNFRLVAAEVGSEFGRGRFSVESDQFIGADGPVDWTVRSSDCALLVSGSASCGGCTALRGNLRARASDHTRTRLALKLDPDSKADVTLMGPSVLRLRLAQEHRLRLNSEEREEALKLKLLQVQPMEVGNEHDASFADLLKGLYSKRHHITDEGATSPTLELLVGEQMKRIANKVGLND